MLNLKAHIRGLFFITLLFIFACEAPHNNPLDPQNPDHQFYSLSGGISSSQNAAQKLSDAQVIWSPQARITHTDINGRFELEKLSPQDGWLYVSKSGFQPDSTFIHWSSPKSLSTTLTLTPRPGLQGTVSGNGSRLAGVQVFWRPSGQTTQTDAAGFYHFHDLDKQDGWLVFEKSGFVSDSMQVKWNGEPLLTRDITLQSLATLRGYVTSQSTPPQPIANVRVFWRNDERFVQTNADGFYELNDLSRRNGWLFFQHDNYQPDSVFIEWQDKTVISKNKQLTARSQRSLFGRVQNELGIVRPIQDVRVTWRNGNRYTLTDTNGDYQFDNLENVDGWLVFERAGYKPDSSFITWPESGDIEQNMRLNAIPELTVFSLSSVVEFNYPDQRRIYVQAEAELTDDERDTRSVLLSSPELGFEAELQYNPGTGLWQREFFPVDFETVEYIRDLVGYEFQLCIIDQEGDRFSLGTERIERVILDEILIDGPINAETVGTRPRHRWQPFTPGFEFTYRLQIYTNDFFNQELVWDEAFELDNATFERTLTDDLAGGSYFWRIQCVDQFGNRSVSKPATFQVAP